MISCSLGEVGSNMKPFVFPMASSSRSATHPLSSTMITEWDTGGASGGGAPAARGGGAGQKGRGKVEAGNRKASASGDQKQPKSEALEVVELEQSMVDESSVVSITPSSEDTLSADDLCTVSLTELSHNSTLIQAQLDASSGEGEEGREGKKDEGERGKEEEPQSKEKETVSSEDGKDEVLKKDISEIGTSLPSQSSTICPSVARSSQSSTVCPPVSKSSQSSTVSKSSQSSTVCPPIAKSSQSSTICPPVSKSSQSSTNSISKPPVPSSLPGDSSHKPASSCNAHSQTELVTPEDDQNQGVPSPSPRDETDGGKEETPPPAEAVSTPAPPEERGRQSGLSGNLVRIETWEVLV